MTRAPASAAPPGCARARLGSRPRWSNALGPAPAKRAATFRLSSSACATAADPRRPSAPLDEAGYAHGWATAQNAVEAIQRTRSDEEVHQAHREAKRALIAGLRDYAIDHDEADVEAWSRAALAAYEDRMKHVRLLAGPAS